MTKTDLIDAVAHLANLSKDDASKAVNGTIQAITDALKAGDQVSLVGFGSFAVKERAARQGRNPQTGAKIQIPARKVARFKPGSKLADAVK